MVAVVVDAAVAPVAAAGTDVVETTGVTAADSRSGVCSASQRAWSATSCCSAGSASYFQRSRSAPKSFLAWRGFSLHAMRRSRYSARVCCAWKEKPAELRFMSSSWCAAQFAASAAPGTGSRRMRVSASPMRWSTCTRSIVPIAFQPAALRPARTSACTAAVRASRLYCAITRLVEPRPMSPAMMPETMIAIAGMIVLAVTRRPSGEPSQSRMPLTHSMAAGYSRGGAGLGFATPAPSIRTDHRTVVMGPVVSARSASTTFPTRAVWARMIPASR